MWNNQTGHIQAERPTCDDPPKTKYVHTYNATTTTNQQQKTGPIVCGSEEIPK
jgi:hypothetical protein